MTWNDFYQRKNAIRAVLDHAGEDPAAPLDPALVPAAATVFADRDELLRALHHKWNRSLTGRVDIGIEDADADPRGDRVEAVSNAWRRTTSDNPVLRRILDSHADEPAIAGLLRQERRTLALAAGLAEPHEPIEEIDRVGHAFMNLLRTSAPQATARRRSPLSQLRRLIPTR
ncbi:hypothetical protein [Saccharopolyspora gloriosae]|uniref:hypothetical protein n=1 Tax=Saccharopolyspora gloriosae TaxID=455344 RepID=UPI001FB6213B|nr:hypothetical protein [Saccharopolyspora gloriosae]